MGRRGPKRRLELESEYWRLLSAGIGTVDACREVGIGRKTGFRWRQENGGLPPARLGSEHAASRFLSHLERQRIASLAERGHGVREIARRLGRAPSTVSRELRRNRSPHDRGGYDGDLAAARARERARRRKPCRQRARAPPGRRSESGQKSPSAGPLRRVEVLVGATGLEPVTCSL